MIETGETQSQLASYVAGETSFEQFEDWLIGKSWNMHQDSAGDTQQLVHEIQSLIYEYLDGYIDESALKSGLSKNHTEVKEVQ